MYPPVETPTSPDDHNMVILDGIATPEPIPKMLRNPFKHFADSLRSHNVDSHVASKESELKRTSLKLDRTTMNALDDNDLLLRNKRYSLNDRDLIMAMSKRKSNTYSNAIPANNTAGADDPSSKPLLDNRPATMETTTSGGGSPSEKDENENYCDGKEIDNKNGNDRIMDCGQRVVGDDNDSSTTVDRKSQGDGNGNKNRHSGVADESYQRLITTEEEEEDADSDGKGSDAKCCVMASNSSSCCLSSGAEENRNSIASSTDESVELREKLDHDELQDEFDEQRELLFGQHQRNSRRLLDNSAVLLASATPEEPMDMLSPNEGPLARRYAEIAQFTGKW